MTYKLVNTKKMYYGHYPYKVTLSFYKTLNKKNVLLQMDDVWLWIKNKFGKTRYQRWKNDWDVRVSESYNVMYVYFRNFPDVEAFMAQFNDNLEIYERPESPEQLELLKNEAKIVIKDALYYNAFRWRIQCKVKTLEDCNEISDWLSEYGENAGWESFKDWVFTSSSGSIYLRDEKQILQLRLGIGNKMKFVEKVVLKSEVEEASNG